MALNILKCNHLMPLRFKGLNIDCSTSRYLCNINVIQ